MTRNRAQGIATPDRSDRPISDIAPEVPLTEGEPAAGNGRRSREEEIRERAYRKYLERGGKEGDADEDWLAAEQELQGRGD